MKQLPHLGLATICIECEKSCLRAEGSDQRNMRGSKPKYPGKQKLRKAQGEQFRRRRINWLGKGQDMVDLSQANLRYCGEGTFNMRVLKGTTEPGLLAEKLWFVTSPTLTLLRNRFGTTASYVTCRATATPRDSWSFIATIWYLPPGGV